MAIPRTSGRSKTGYAVFKYTKLDNHEAEINMNQSDSWIPREYGITGNAFLYLCLAGA